MAGNYNSLPPIQNWLSKSGLFCLAFHNLPESILSSGCSSSSNVGFAGMHQVPSSAKGFSDKEGFALQDP